MGFKFVQEINVENLVRNTTPRVFIEQRKKEVIGVGSRGRDYKKRDSVGLGGIGIYAMYGEGKL